MMLYLLIVLRAKSLTKNISDNIDYAYHKTPLIDTVYR